MKNPQLGISLILAAILAIAACAFGQTPAIRKIDFIRLNVFDKNLQNSNNFIYRLGNKFHAVTKERIIRQEMLLRPGQNYDSSSFAQSLRNIRALDFIGEVKTQLNEVPGDSLDIIITTEDLWTTVAGISSESGGGNYKIMAYCDEKNIAGLGVGLETSLQFAQDKDNGFSINAYDNRILGTRNIASCFISRFKFSRQFDILLTRPFYRPQTRWSFAISAQFNRYRQRLFSSGQEYFRYKKNFDFLQLKQTRAFGIYKRIEPYLYYTYQHDYYGIENPASPYNNIIPADKTFSGPGLGVSLTTINYDTARYLDEFGTTEDFNYHYLLDFHSARSAKFMGGDKGSLSYGMRAAFLQNPIPALTIGFSNAYIGHETKTGRFLSQNQLEAACYVKMAKYHLLAGHIFTSYVWNHESDYQLVLGGGNGLRGYPDRYYSGTKMLLLNGEYRVFSPWTILTVGLGGAAFFDAGYVWGDRQMMRLGDLKKDIGIGLRFGLTKSSTARTIRIDLARGLDRKVTYLSMGTSSVFDLSPFK
jgi:outer membrane protein assembly factor BamA